MDDDDKEKNGGKLILFPNGQSLNSEELGTGYVVDQGGQVPTAEVVDSREIAQEYHDREDFVASEEIVLAVEHGETREVISSVLKEITIELSHLKYERQKAAKEGKNTANYTIQRVAGLRQLADVLLKRQENMRAEQLDLKSPRFQSVLKLWMEFVYESMQKSGLGDQEVNLVFNTMKADMVDWERKILDAT